MKVSSTAVKALLSQRGEQMFRFNLNSIITGIYILGGR